MLVRWGWQPLGPTTFVTPGGMELVYQPGADLAYFRHLLADSVETVLWAQADPWAGKVGSTKGVDLTAAKGFYKQLGKKGCYKEQTILLRIGAQRAGRSRGKRRRT